MSSCHPVPVRPKAIKSGNEFASVTIQIPLLNCFVLYITVEVLHAGRGLMIMSLLTFKPRNSALRAAQSARLGLIGMLTGILPVVDYSVFGLQA